MMRVAGNEFRNAYVADQMTAGRIGSRSRGVGARLETAARVVELYAFDPAETDTPPAAGTRE
jgi:hypothetical protein